MGGNPLFGDWGSSPRADPESEPVFVETPVDRLCLICEEQIQEGDVGEMMSVVGVETTYWMACHRECLILNTVGHMVGVCSCSDYLGMTKREAAIEAARRLDSGWLEMREEGKAILDQAAQRIAREREAEG